jgi:hypothetical protein
MYINENLFKNLIDDSHKSVEEVITNTEILKDIYSVIKSYLYTTHYYSNETAKQFLQNIQKQELIINKKNIDARHLYQWLHGKEFDNSKCILNDYYKDAQRLISELRNLVKHWDDEEDEDIESQAEGLNKALLQLTATEL